jgi:plasmid segregation protein ParM
MKVVDERSGSTPGGMSHVLEALAGEVALEKGESFDDINELDRGLRRGGKMTWFGESYDFSHLLAKAAIAAESPCASMRNSVGNVRDIDVVLVVGGGAEFFIEPIRRQFKHSNIQISNESMYANVRGFFLAGEQRARKYG